MTLGLDLSTKSTGYAVFKGSILVDYGCCQSSHANVIQRIFYMLNEIDRLFQKYDITDIYVEEVIPKADVYDDRGQHHSNPTVFKPLMWLQAGLMFLIHQKKYKAKVEFILPNSWRAILGIKTGRGVKRDTLKQADCAYVLQHFGIKANDDICDAICIAYSKINKSTQDYDWS